MRFFIDTNIIISAALFPQGKTAQVFSYILESHQVVIADYTFDELRDVFNRKFPDRIDALVTFMNGIDFTLFLTPSPIDPKLFPEIRDINDLPILASALLSHSDILLTGDKDFADIKIDNLLIFTPAEYFKFIDK